MNFVDCLPAAPVYAVVVAAVDSLHFSAEADAYDTLLWCWTVRSNVSCSKSVARFSIRHADIL